ncbi:MAG TPA: type II toxin-antitoxin system VapC family toxin [Conexibacter sp.]|nr:type II toxin-antitoxin system VapC family toxin [Conexibacter sp.]
MPAGKRIVMHRRGGDLAVETLDDLLLSAGVRCVALDVTHVHAARDAWLRYGKGRSPAGLNFGDCFSYALAKTTGRPLLFKGEDFGQTDVTPAAP